MSALPEKIEVMCPKCGEDFGGWYQSSSDPAASSTCPRCGYRMGTDASLFSEGVWDPALDEIEEMER
jgi:hypothetical protein